MKSSIKPKLAFVDHSFHQKTRSSDFFRSILEENFTVTTILDDSWKGTKNVTAEDLNRQNFDYVLFWQTLLPASELKKINSNLIWVPMYDDIVWQPHVFWQELSTVRIKVISLCKRLGEISDSVGLDNLKIQYFENNSKYKAVTDYKSKKIFFWQRTDFNINDLIKLIGNQKISELSLKLSPDPNFQSVLPSESDIKKYNIKYVKQSKSREEYLNIIRNCNIFVAPRKYEGIGMSFIEAMELGMAVIAYNAPTMSEYIEDGVNGYLFDKKGEIDLQNFEKVGRNARESCMIGFKKWSKSVPQISKFILSNYKSPQKFNFVWHLSKGVYWIRRHVFGQLYNLKQFIRHYRNRAK